MEIKNVFRFLREGSPFFLATVENGVPKVRPFGAILLYEDKLYFMTGKSKDVYQQLKKDPHVELSNFMQGKWMRVSGELIEDDRLEARQAMIDAYPGLSNRYKPNDGNMVVFYLKNGKAVLQAFGGQKTTCDC